MKLDGKQPRLRHIFCFSALQLQRWAATGLLNSCLAQTLQSHKKIIVAHFNMEHCAAAVLWGLVLRCCSVKCCGAWHSAEKIFAGGRLAPSSAFDFTRFTCKAGDADQTHPNS